MEFNDKTRKAQKYIVTVGGTIGVLLLLHQMRQKRACPQHSNSAASSGGNHRRHRQAINYRHKTTSTKRLLLAAEWQYALWQSSTHFNFGLAIIRPLLRG